MYLIISGYDHLNFSLITLEWEYNSIALSLIWLEYTNMVTALVSNLCYRCIWVVMCIYWVPCHLTLSSNPIMPKRQEKRKTLTKTILKNTSFLNRRVHFSLTLWKFFFSMPDTAGFDIMARKTLETWSYNIVYKQFITSDRWINLY